MTVEEKENLNYIKCCVHKSLGETVAINKEKLQNLIAYLDSEVDQQTLADWYISSCCDEEDSIWTQEHFKELLNDFDLRRKE